MINKKSPSFGRGSFYLDYLFFLKIFIIENKVLVLLLERLNKIAKVKRNSAKILLVKETAIAIVAAKAGKSTCILACLFSISVNGVLSIVSDLITYLRILNKTVLMSIILTAKKMIAVSE
jgi:hypothetical protein